MTQPATSALEQASQAIDSVADGADLLDVLQAVQQAVGFVPPQMVPLIAEKTGAARPVIYQAIELTPSLTLKPPGRHLLYICSADNCCSKGGLALAETAQAVLGAGFYQCDASQTVRLEPFRCLGHCIQGPNISIDGQVHGPMTPEALRSLLGNLLARPA